MAKQDTLFVIPASEDRLAQTVAADIGDTIAIARRISTDMGISSDQIREHLHQIRGILDQTAHRAKRKAGDRRKYTVENGSFVTRDGSFMLVAVCTRVE